MTPDPAQSFDALAADARWRTFDSGERRKVDRFVGRWGIRAGARVLEPGCGAGRLTEVLAGLTGPGGRVVAFDPCPAFIRLARQRGLPPHVELVEAALEALPIEVEAFDQVICFNVFPHLAPLVPATHRLAAALRPGGSLWIAHTRSQASVNALHREGPPEFHNHILPLPEELALLLEGAGLGGIAIENGADGFLAHAVRLAPDGASVHPPRHG